jgi:DNA-binding NarL/FixJ family response regulator
MASGQVAHSTVSPANVLLESSVPRAVASYEGELTRTRLREALAREETLLRRIDTLIRRQQVLDMLFIGGEDAAHRLESLTSREHEIMERVLAGDASKNIAVDLGISRRTVEKHRASVMKKTRSTCLPALARLALAAAVVTGAAASVVSLDAGRMNQRIGGKS